MTDKSAAWGLQMQKDWKINIFFKVQNHRLYRAKFLSIVLIQIYKQKTMSSMCQLPLIAEMWELFTKPEDVSKRANTRYYAIAHPYEKISWRQL